MLALLQQSLLVIIIASLGSNWFLKLSENGLINGLRVDYLIPKLYFTDLLIVGYLLVSGLILLNSGGIKNFLSRFYKKPEVTSIIIIVLLALLFFRQLFTPFPLAAVTFFIQTCLHLLFFAVLLKQRPSTSLVIWGLVIGMSWQSLLGLYQFATQQALAGYGFLGEPAIGSALNLARGDFWFIDSNFGTRLGLRVLPYGTFPHPNILAGYIATGMLSVLRLNSVGSSKSAKAQPAYTYLIFIAFCLLWTACLFLTQSLMAVLVLLIGLILFIKPIRVLMLGVLGFFLISSLTLPVIQQTLQLQQTSVTRRVALTFAAEKLFWAAPVWGVGVQQFTAFMEGVLPTNEPVRFVQPVHNVFLLLAAETGLLGSLLCFIFCKAAFKNTSKEVLLVLAVLSPILFFDHYLLSIAQGQLVFGIFILANFKMNHSRIH